MNNPHGSLEDKIPAIDQEISNNNNHKHYSLLPPPYLGMLRTLKKSSQFCILKPIVLETVLL